MTRIVKTRGQSFERKSTKTLTEEKMLVQLKNEVVCGAESESKGAEREETRIKLQKDECEMGLSPRETRDHQTGEIQPEREATHSALDPSPKTANEVKLTVGRQKLKSDGVYVRSRVQEVPVLFTADTGAAKSVLSKKVFDKIPVQYQPELNASTPLSSVNGGLLKEYGKGKFTIYLDSMKLEAELVVAEIEDEGLLGLDILMTREEGPAEIKLASGEIVMNGTVIPCIRIGNGNKVRKVTLADDYTVQPFMEHVIDVYIQKEDGDDLDPNQNYIVEPDQHFSERCSLVMASTIVNTGRAVTNKVRVLNPFPNEIKLYQDNVIGTAEQVQDDDVIQICDVEDESEVNNHHSLRRIKFITHSALSPENESEPVRIVSEVSEQNFGLHKQLEIPQHLAEMHRKACQGKNEEEQRVVLQTLCKYADAFSASDTDLGCTHLVYHSINTGDARPIRQPPRKVPLAFADEEKKVIQQMEENGIIRKSNSPWASPLCLVRKKNGKVRPCVDYRRLNTVTKQDAFPLPRTQDLLDAVAGAKYFSTFDLTAGYHQVPMDPDDIQKTAFVTKYGLYEFLTMPFGMTCAPATFQRLMELALQGLQWNICLIYLDDVIVYGSTVVEHMSRVEQVLQRIKEAGMKLKPEKCNLLQEEVEFLGHVINEKGVMPNPDNVAKLIQMETPTNLSAVRRMIGLGSYYRRFIPGFSNIVRPLVELTKKDVKFHWSPECQIAFEQLKLFLKSANIMAYPRNEGQFVLDTDASDYAIGAVLSQEQDGEERVIAYGSHTMGKSEKNYCVTDKELLALRFFIEYYKQYLLGRKFVVRTDHQALVWLFKLKEPKGRIARWLEILSPYDFTVEYRMGTKHSNADTMSRCFNPRNCECATMEVDNMENLPLKCGPCNKCRRRTVQMMGEMIGRREKSRKIEEGQNNEVRAVSTRSKGTELGKPLLYVSRQEVQEKQKGDPGIGVIYQWVIRNEKPTYQEVCKMNPDIRHYWQMWESLAIKDNLLYKLFHTRNGISTYYQLLVPAALRSTILHHMHSDIIGGHHGVKETYSRLKQKYYWYEAKQDVLLWVRKCDTCARVKMSIPKPKAGLGDMRVGATMDRLATDLLGPLPETPRGNRYVLVVTDHFSKWVEVLPVPDQTAKTVADAIVKDVICRLGCPLSLHSDQGRCYESEIFREVCGLFHIKKTRTSPRNPGTI